LTDITMSGGETVPDETAPLVAVEASQSESSLLRELVGDAGDYREVDMGDAGSKASSGLSELESEVEEEWEGKDHGRLNFRRAAPGAGQQQSTQEFFRRGNDSLCDDIFSELNKQIMRGALAHSLSAAAGSPQQVGMAQTLKGAKDLGEEVQEGGSKGAEGMDMATIERGREEAAMDWAGATNQKEEEGIESMAEPDRLATPPSPTPARWATPTPVPVTPTRGSKRRAVAVGTPRPQQVVLPPWRQVGIPSQGWTSGAALGEVMAAIAAAEARLTYRMEERVVALERKMVEGMAALSADAEGRLQPQADAEEREKRVAVKLLATEGIELELLQRAQCENQRWEELGERLRERKKEIGAVKKVVDGLAQRLGDAGVSHPGPRVAAPTQRAPIPCPLAAPPLAVVPAVPREGKKPRGSVHQQYHQAAANEVTARVDKAELQPEKMEGVVAMAPSPPEQEDPVEDWSDMEGVERGGLYTSPHAPTMGEPEPTAPRTILKCPETVAAGKVVKEKAAKEAKEVKARKKAEEKEVARKRWEDWDKITEMERRTYDEAAGPIKALSYEEDTIEGTAVIQRVAHKAGIRAVEERWE